MSWSVFFALSSLKIWLVTWAYSTDWLMDSTVLRLLNLLWRLEVEFQDLWDTTDTLSICEEYLTSHRWMNEDSKIDSKMNEEDFQKTNDSESELPEEDPINDWILRRPQ